MFYNYCRSTKSGLIDRDLKSFRKTQRSVPHSPTSRILNIPKRQKLKNLLMVKFMEKYNINYPDAAIEKEVTRFVQGEKLTDRDLQRLNNRIQKLVRNGSASNILEKNLTNRFENNLNKYKNGKNKINYEQQGNNFKTLSPEEQLNEHILSSPNNNNHDINNTNSKNTLEQRSDAFSLPKVNEKNTDNNNNIDDNNKKLQRSQSSINMANKTLSIFPKRNFYQNKCFKSPEEELAELEKELEIHDYHTKTKKEPRIDFSKEGNEWSAISKYKQKLYRQQLIEEKIKENEIRKRTKEELDNQIKQKIKKEHEENLREKKFNELLNEKLKKMDEIDKIKSEKIKSQFIREKESRDKLLKDINIRRKIEFLKEKKLDNELLSNAKRIWQKEINDKYMQKKILNEELNKTIKEVEQKKIKLKNLIQREKEEELIILKEQQKTEERQDKQRQKIFDKINYNMNKFIIRNAEEIVAKNRLEQQKEEEKMQYYIEEKRKEMEKQEIMEKVRKQKEKLELKKFLDMQVEEKKKEKNFLKELEHEQARIWNIDAQKYTEDEKLSDNKYKMMKKKNFEYIIQQMKENDQKKIIKHTSDMTNDEYEMNKELLEKAKNSFLNEEKTK
jgi:hypothetical protein